jgi:hypothetical protein
MLSKVKSDGRLTKSTHRPRSLKQGPRAGHLAMSRLYPSISVFTSHNSIAQILRYRSSSKASFLVKISGHGQKER